MSKDVKRIIELDQQHDLGLCHGLAPNPFGFSFEATGKLKVDKLVRRILSDIECNEDETFELKRYIRGN